jgi:uncharacterized membrane protein
MERYARAIVAAAFLCIVLGAGFRFWRLDGSVFCTDEMVGAYHAAGYRTADVRGRFAAERPVRASEARRFAAPNPVRSERDVVAGLAHEDALHPPLFYVAERRWLELVGPSIVARRALSAVFGVLGIAAAGWLCALITRRAIGGWIGAALFALSPFQVVYAQEMLEYSLFATLTCASTALLLLAVRRPGFVPLAAYALAAVAGLYTYPLFLLVIAAHLTIPIVLRAPRPTLLGVGAAAAAASVRWIPWLWAIIALREKLASTGDWSGTRWSPPAIVLKSLFNASTAFFDATYADVRWAPVTALVLVAIAVALASLRKAPREAQAVVWTLLAWCFGSLALMDFAVGAHRSTVVRYVVPALCALVVAVAVWVVSAWERPRRSVMPAGVALALCAAGVVSLIVRAQHPAWWDNAKDGGLPAIASAIDHAGLPVLVTDANWLIVLDVADYTRTDPTFIMVPAERVQQVVARMRRVLVLTTSYASRAEVRDEPHLRAKLVYASSTVSSVSLFRNRLVEDAGSEDRDPYAEDSRAALLRVVNPGVAAGPPDSALSFDAK